MAAKIKKSLVEGFLTNKFYLKAYDFVITELQLMKVYSFNKICQSEKLLPHPFYISLRK